MTFVERVVSVLVLVFVAVLHPVSTAGADPGDPSTWPLAEGDFSSPGDPGWIYFKPSGFGGGGCGIGPDGTIGCDIVPGRWDDGTPVQAGLPGPPGSYSCDGRRCPLPPAGANQIVVSPQQPAQYVQSGVPTFTRDVDVLYPGYRLVNGEASCRLAEQGTIGCFTGDNVFALNGVFAILD